jgi:membrane fusion protein (multidrug efflux system)
VRWLPLLLGIACSVETGGDAPAPDEADEGKEKPDPVTVVEVAEVGRGGVADEISTSAIVESEARADLVPEATGVVVEVRADEGDRVEAGTVLAVLDNVTLGTGAAVAHEEVARLEAEVAAARGLAKSGAISSRELEDLEFRLRTARLSSTEASRAFGQTRITAPFSGVVAARHIHVGELATSTSPAFELVDPTRLRVVASLPERDLGRVRIGQPARLVSAYDEEARTSGTVIRIAPVVDSRSGTFRVTIGLGEEGTLLPGQFVSVRIEVARHEGVTVVPKDAVVWEDGAPVVYRVVPEVEKAEEDEKEDEEKGWLARWWGGEEENEEEEDLGPKLVAARTAVQLGLVDDERAEILTGLTVGDTVITVGQSHLRDGARVRTAAEAEAARAEANEGAG